MNEQATVREDNRARKGSPTKGCPVEFCHLLRHWIIIPCADYLGWNAGVEVLLSNDIAARHGTLLRVWANYAPNMSELLEREPALLVEYVPRRNYHRAGCIGDLAKSNDLPRQRREAKKRRVPLNFFASSEPRAAGAGDSSARENGRATRNGREGTP